MALPNPRQAPPPASLVGDHLALDLLNTRARSASGETIEHWETGEDVRRWLEQIGMPSTSFGSPGAVDHDELLVEAKALRELARRLISTRAQGDGSPDLSALNAYLHKHPSTLHIERDANGNPALLRVPCGETPSSLLGPVAEAVAELLVEGDFSLVKQCGGPECVLWFHDRTRGGKRRWCSMAVCGNRQKVARFRKRAAAAGPAPSAGDQ